ncbi:hypothetical protein JCM13664_06600 [Methylothermus subterraneus]
MPFTPSAQPTGWISRPTASGPLQSSGVDVSSGAENTFRSSYIKDDWSGNILALHVSGTGVIGNVGPWDPETAASKLYVLDWDSGRKIVTMNGSSKVPFRWSNLSSAQQADLGSPDVLNYIRGDRSNEDPAGKKFRARNQVLGDILHSTLYFWDHASTPGSPKRLYVGANDGMLHVFDADSGEEVFAYVPSMLIPKLNKLVANPYNHTAFVDGQIAIARVDYSGGAKTILVGGLGAGEKGLFALDVSNPTPANETEAASKILWEITPSSSGFADLGYVFGTPRIARLNDGTAVAIVGNGYMNGGSGHSVLYVINLATGALIKAIDTGSGSSTSPAGLSTPALVDADDDGKVDYAYAGDIDGKLWKFDLRNIASATASLLYSTSPAQAITVPPVVRPHPHGGYMVVFATGRILSADDVTDTSTHYVYGIWDGAPAANDTLLTQTFTATTKGSDRYRTITANAPDWSPGSGHHKGWQVALPAGERVVGEAPFYNLGRYYFVSTNPTVSGTPAGENWLNELDFFTGGGPSCPIFDLDLDGEFCPGGSPDSGDLADNGEIPVAKFMGPGVLSQPLLIRTGSYLTTFYNWHPDTTGSTATVIDPADPGVSGGHFDFDIYYYDSTAITSVSPTSSCETRTVCSKSSDVSSAVGTISTAFCNNTNGFSAGFEYLSSYIEGASCDKKKINNQITCCTYTSTTAPGSYKNVKHVHEYDDKYDVTGVNMLNASLVDFNLNNAIADPGTQFKILVMNQYLSPAAMISVGGSPYVKVKDYGGLAGPETDPAKVLAAQPVYTLSDINTLIYNLPLDAFKSKDWWGDGGKPRAGLIPTQTGCVNKVNADGTMLNSGGKGRIGPNGERFDGALTFQIIKANTPPEAIELNHSGGDVRYGWRVKQSEFTKWVLAEYTTFWHHPNGKCYGDPDWQPDPPQDPVSDAKSETPAPGSADPKDGIFSGGSAVISETTTTSGNTTTTVVTYANGTSYTKIEKVESDGSVWVKQILPDGSVNDFVCVANCNGDSSGSAIGPTAAPYEQQGVSAETRRQSWRELLGI